MNPATIESSQPVRLLDGGVGSELRRRGIELSPTSWSAAANLTHAQVIKAIHADYIEAGADIITANTFATTRFVLEAAGLGAQFEAINRAAVRAACDARSETSRNVKLAASLSCLPPAFDRRAYPEPAAEFSGYLELAANLRDHGVELLLLEMLQHPDHAARACRAAQESGLPFWVGLSCRLDPATQNLVAFDASDQTIAAVLDACRAFAPKGVAIMHSPIGAVEPALRWLREAWDGPIGCWAEMPYPEDPAAKSKLRIEPEHYAKAAARWLDLGASLIGGCCGTTPAHIAALRELIDGQ